MLSTETWIVLSYSFILSLAVLFLIFFLAQSYRRKKTPGTAMLMIAYILFSLTTLVPFINRVAVLFNYNIYLLYLLNAITPLSIIFAYAFLYQFASRHILRDNEIKRLIVFSITVIIYGVLVGLIIADSIIYPNTKGLIITKTPSTPELYTISYSMIVILFQVLVSLYFTIRIAGRAFILSKKTGSLESKKGLQSIALGLVLYLAAGLLTPVLSMFEGLIASIIGTIIRVLIFVAAYTFMYLGWIMPTWYRKLLRKKTWFEQQYAKTS